MNRILLILVSAVVLASCSCSSKKSARNIKSNDFNELVMFADSNVMSDYRGFAFYEASASLSNIDSLAKKGVIDQSSFMAVYDDLYAVRTLQATFDSLGNISYQVIDSPWLEDMIMTPYVPLYLDQAIELLAKNNIEVYAGQPVVLRHQLWFNEPEPRYFIGSVSDCNTVNVYTNTINQQLAEPTKAWLQRNKGQLLTDSFVEEYLEEYSIE